MSSGHCVSMPPLRTRDRINLSGRSLTDSDLGALLGALSLNSYLKELDLSGNPAPSKGGIKAAMIASLPWPLLRAYGTIRPQNVLEDAHMRNLVLDNDEPTADDPLNPPAHLDRSGDACRRTAMGE